MRCERGGRESHQRGLGRQCIDAMILLATDW